MKTTEVDLDKISAYLKNQVGWVPLAQIRKAIPTKHANAMKIEAMRHLGLLERDGENVKLTAAGRGYAAGDIAGRAAVMRTVLRGDPLYNATLEWFHYNDKTEESKTDIANYWHDNHHDAAGQATGDALTDATVFFMRMVGIAELGKFSAAGRGRDTHLTLDEAQLAEFATGAPPVVPPPEVGAESPVPEVPTPVSAPSVRSTSISTGLNVNVEIHIAADAKPSTVEEIFKNMRRYLLDSDPPTDDR
jgi:hypothetical protein